MAGNFWQSSHCAQWVLDKVDLARERAPDMAVLSEDEYSKIMIFYCSFIQVLGEQLKLRQQVNETRGIHSVAPTIFTVWHMFWSYCLPVCLSACVCLSVTVCGTFF